ncbi:MAG TPA: histidine--tRNA ligase [Candidatus Fermentibacter daniensis]|jgi:histidyl-tRNA synthetase|nr:MAG: hypothetical protein AO394_05665 [Candidatus Fermentibacter daniensis]HOA05404.1 histidine--tRNA ligase [Candidatus Fermentibacter daniensis]HOG55118.1 histidine--tRNA ligase [Candidatus Fermentibacter daniensis]
MELSTKPLTGMRQLYPDEMAVEAYIVGRIRDAALAYGFEEYDGPTIEPVELFLAKSGEELVSEQSYLFEDRGGRRVVLRPEMTPSLARMLASAPEVSSPVRWMSFPVCFRYERPQRGRAREFRQFNLDVLGSAGVMGDLEVMLVLDRIMKNLGAPDGAYQIGYSSRELATGVLERIGIAGQDGQKALGAIDRIGKMQPDEWTAYAEAVLGDPGRAVLLGRFASVRSLDDPWMRETASGLPGFDSMLELRRLLEAAGLRAASFDASIVRGLDYYTGTVFELSDTGGGNRRAICGGGRYDNLVGLFGGRPMGGVGFGLGILTLRLFLETYGLIPADPGAASRPDVFVAVYSSAEAATALSWAESLRSSGLRVMMEIEGRSLSRQFRAAGRCGARFVVVAGPDEVASNTASVKNMETGETTRVQAASVAEHILSVPGSRQDSR